MSTVGEAGTITTIDANTIPSVTGNGGSLTKGDPEEQWTTVHLQGTYTDPVVIIGVPSEVGGEEAVPRLRNLRYGPAAPDDGCDGHCFDVRMQEPSCRDDLHLAETIPYLVIEAGTWYTDGVLRGVAASHSRHPEHL